MPGNPKRLKIFAEGQGDVAATVALVKRILAGRDDHPFEHLILDTQPFRINGIHDLTGRVASNWIDRIVRASRQPNVGGILVILDGDADTVLVMNEQTRQLEKRKFCAAEVAIQLVEKAKTAGAGIRFSLACVFAVMEYESWLTAGIQSLSNARIEGLHTGLVPPENIEQRRGAKAWISKRMDRGYKPSIHQLPMTEALVLNEVRNQNLRSFRRLEKAVDELVRAFRDDKYIVSPSR